MPKTKTRRLKRGVDWHAWVWKNLGQPVYKTDLQYGEMMFWAEPERPKEKHPTEKGKWVKVRFVEV